MNKITTKAIALFTALLILMTALPMSATAATTDSESVGNYVSGSSGDCSWTVDMETHHMEISGNGKMADYSDSTGAPYWVYGVTVTSVTINWGVTHIGNESFKGVELDSITIPETVVSIGNRAFEGTTITSITIPNSVKTIGEKAFFGCNFLIRATMPSRMNSIGKSAFQNCVELKKITVPAGITKLEDYVFAGCSDLKEISLPSTLTSIGNYSFSGLSNLTDITLPQRLTSIGEGAFENCASIETINLPQSLTMIGDSGLQNTVWFNNLPDGLLYFGNILLDCKGEAPAVLKIPESIISIAGGSFRNRESLMRIKLPTTMKRIGANAFKNCTNLIAVDFSMTEVTTTIDAGAFTDCPDLVFSCYRDTPVYQYAQSKSITCSIIGGRTGDCIWRQVGNRLIIKGNGAMTDYSNQNDTPWSSGITEVVLSNGVTHIGSWAFTKLTGLQKLVVSKTLTSVSKNNPNYNPKQRPTDINKPMLHHLPYSKQSNDIAIYIHTENENLKDDINRYGNSHYIYLGKMGDQNGDNKIDVRDVTALQRHLAELKNLSEVRLYGADTNDDGLTDINDATYLQMYLAEYNLTIR